ncbi:MAG: hypothetical protein U0802_13570 [Candidatus Binatia bacterium]
MAGKVTHKTGKPNRDALLSVPLTRGQKRAVIRAAEKLGLDAAAYARMRILAETPYDPAQDEDLGTGAANGDSPPGGTARQLAGRRRRR